jgi:hypothetical protein
MLRIWIAPTDGGVIVRLEGRLLSAWRDELLDACDRAAHGGAQVRLDLHSLTYADADGIELLRTLIDERGVALGACSRFVAELLNASHGERKDIS